MDGARLAADEARWPVLTCPGLSGSQPTMPSRRVVSSHRPSSLSCVLVSTGASTADEAPLHRQPVSRVSSLAPQPCHGCHSPPHPHTHTPNSPISPRQLPAPAVKLCTAPASQPASTSKAQAQAHAHAHAQALASSPPSPHHPSPIAHHPPLTTHHSPPTTSPSSICAALPGVG